MREIARIAFRWIRPFTLLRWTIYFCAAAVLWLCLDFRLLQQYFQARQRHDDYKEQLRQTKERNAKAIQANRELRQGGFKLEQEARLRQMIKPGERVIEVRTPEPQASPAIKKPSGDDAPETPAPGGDTGAQE